MDPEEVGAALREAVEAYCATRRHPDLSAFTVHPAQGVQAWWGSPESAGPGCYAYTSTPPATSSTSARPPWAPASEAGWRPTTTRRPRAWWRDAAAFVVLVTVAEPFEAPSLEEYLIDRTPARRGTSTGSAPHRVAAGPP